MKDITKVEAFRFGGELHATERDAVKAAIRKASQDIIAEAGGNANLATNLMQRAEIFAPLLTRLLELEKPTVAPVIVDPSVDDDSYSGPSINGSPRLEM